MSVNLNAKPVCTTRVTNFCASEEGNKQVRLADRLSDAGFAASSGQPEELWNTFAKEFYEFMRPTWIASDNLSDKGRFQKSFYDRRKNRRSYNFSKMIVNFRTRSYTFSQKTV